MNLEHWRCDCMSNLMSCTNCHGRICPVHARTVMKLNIEFAGSKKFPPSNQTHYFCSGACLFSWNLQEAADHLGVYGSVDVSWIDVIKQIRAELERSMKESIDRSNRNRFGETGEI